MKLKQFMFALVAMVLGFAMPTSAENGNVAKVGNTEYATIDEAIANWTNGTTLTLLANVTLSDVIKLSSTEHHILDLGTFTMTAAKNKDAIQYVVNGRTSASYALDIKADANNPGGITATGKAIVSHTKPLFSAPDKDRPITRFYSGVFNATNIVAQQGTFGGTGYANAKAPHFYFYGGEFNGKISTNRSHVQIHGGTFNGELWTSFDSSSYGLVKGGKFKYLSNLMGSNLDEKIAQGKDNYKFTIGSAKMTYDRGIYVDEEGYYVITSAPIKEVSAEYPAVFKKTYGGDDYFYYSAAQEYGLFYKNVEMAIAKHGEANVTVWEKPAVTIPENVTGDATVVDEIKNNTALEGYTPENLPAGAELEIELKSVGETFVYDVTPMANGAKVETTEAITFRLPVPASVTTAYAKVYHEGTLMGLYEIKGEGNAKYVEISSADFSVYTVEPTTPVAKIDETAYATLADAVAAAQNDATITLIDNVVLAERVTIPADKTLTIDLNGKSISMEESIIATAYAINNLGNLTITDGVGGGSINARGMYNGYGDGGENVASATMTILGGTFNAKGTNGGAAIFNYGAANVNGGKFTSVGSYSLSNQSGSTMIIADGVSANNGVYNSNATLTINGGEISGNRSGCHVIYAWNSKLTINGGTLHNNNAGNATILADGAANVTINGGTFSINNGQQTHGWTSCLLDANGGATYVINDGEFKGHFRVQANSTMNINGGTFENTHNEAYAIYGTAVVKGGTFTDVTAKAFATKYVAEGYELGENGTVAAKPVAMIGEVKYATLEEAVAAAQVGNIITMLADATLSAELTLPAGITLNGNGKQINGNIVAAGNLTIAGHTKVTNFNAGYNKPTITIGEDACLELTGTGRMVIGHGATFNITGTISDAKTADKATLTPSLIMPGASFTGAGVTFNVTNAYVKAPSSYCSSSKSASGTFDFNITNSIWESAGKLAFEEQSVNAKVDFALVNSVLTTGSHLVFGTASGEEGVVIDNSNVNEGTNLQIENCGTMTIKNGSVVNGAVATSSNAKNPGTLTVENSTYNVTGEFSGSDLGTGTIIIKKDANFTAGSVTKANIVIDATDMTAGELANFTANLAKFAGELSVINNAGLNADIVDGKIVLVEKTLAGEGTESNPYLIKTADDLVLFRNSVNAGETKYNAEGKYVALGANIDLDGIENWEPIGTFDYSFDSNFDGKGFAIQNLKMVDNTVASGYAYLGFFGVTANNVVKNFVIENVTIQSAGQIVAAAIAYPYYTTVSDITVKGDIAIKGGNYTAGVLAYTRLCQNACNLAVVGNEGSYITGAQVVGGVIADIQMNKGLVANYSNFSAEGVTVSGTKNVGGISGIIATQTLNGATVKNVTLVSDDARVGAVSGSLGGTSTISDVTTENVTGATAVIGATYEGKAIEAKINETYFATVENAMASEVAGEVEILTDVTIDETEEYTFSKQARVNGTLTYQRSFAEGYWNTLFVPFEIPMSMLSDYDVAYINDMHSYDKNYDGVIEEFGLEVIYIKDETATLNASHPYVIRPKNAEAAYMELVLTDATLFSSLEQTDVTCSSAYMNFTFKGSYSEIAVSETDRYYILTVDENGEQTFGYAPAGSTLKPYRFYFTMESRGGSYVKVDDTAFKSVRIYVQGEGDTTGIVGTEFDTNGEELIYDLQGRRVLEPKKGGIYIINGKKVYYNK